MLSLEPSAFPQPSWRTEPSRVCVDELYGAIALFRRGTKLSQTTSLSPTQPKPQTASVPKSTATPIVQSLVAFLSKLNTDFEQYSSLLAPSTRGNVSLASDFKQLPLSTRLEARNKTYSQIEITQTTGTVSGRVFLTSQSLAQRLSSLNSAFVSGHAGLESLSGNVILTSSTTAPAPAPQARATSLAARLQALNTSFARASVQTMMIASGSASLRSTPLDTPLASALQNKSHQFDAIEELVHKLSGSVQLISSPSPLPVSLARLSSAFTAATNSVLSLSGNVPLLSQSTEKRLVSNLHSLSNAFDIATNLIARSSGSVPLLSTPAAVKSAQLASKLAALSDAYDGQTEHAYLLTGLVPLLAAPPRSSPIAPMSFPSLAQAITTTPRKSSRRSASPRLPRSLSAASLEGLLARSPSPIPNGRSPRPGPATPLPHPRVRELARLDTQTQAAYAVLSPSSMCSDADTAWSVTSPTSAGCASCAVGSPIASPITHMCQCAVPELVMPPASEVVPSDGYRTGRRHSVPDDLSTLSIYHFEMSEDTSRVKMRSLGYRLVASGGDVRYPLE